MPGAARAYKVQPIDEVYVQPQMQVMRGQNRHAQENSMIIQMFVTAVVVIVLLCCVAAVRIWLTNASMLTLVQTNEIEASIASAKQTGSDLEVQYYEATDPITVKAYASKELGMSAISGDVTYIDVTPEYIASAVTEVIEAAYPQISMVSSRSATPKLLEDYSSSLMSAVVSGKQSE